MEQNGGQTVTRVWNAGEAMPLFYFDIRENGELVVDHEGIELGSLEEACDQARRALTDILGDLMHDHDRAEVCIEIRTSPGEKFVEAVASSSVINTRDPKQ